MKEPELSQSSFEINVSLSGSNKTIIVYREETSDGLSYFVCKENNETITQLRENVEGHWEQLWGVLDQQSIDLIGAEIKK